MANEASTYSSAGVDTEQEEQGLYRLTDILQATWVGDAKPELPWKLFANVVRIDGARGMAITTDGVGTKVIVAQMLGRYDTLGIDCVAMNVNDLICVGATPLTMVDYIALQKPDPELLSALGRGLQRGALEANVSIVGGEIAQLPEILKSDTTDNGFDIAGTAIGMVPLDRIVVGKDIEPGDAVVGIASSGIHSNGLTLARSALLGPGSGLTIDSSVPELEGTVGEELLRPTHIYVREVLQLLAEIPSVKALIHITSDGLLNLDRVLSDTGYEIDALPDPPPIFNLIKERGSVDIAEMFRVFNMGIGFCVVLPAADASRAISITKEVGKKDAWVIGRTVHDPCKRVKLLPHGLESDGRVFKKAARD